MSRNLCSTDCYYCNGIVKLTGPVHSGTADYFGVYADQYEGMLIAEAECVECEAKYMAWVDERTRKSDKYHSSDRWSESEGGFIDLSFRSTFNDEPGGEDLPNFIIEEIVIRNKKPVKRHAKCGLPVLYEYCLECSVIVLGNDGIPAADVAASAFSPKEAQQ